MVKINLYILASESPLDHVVQHSLFIIPGTEIEFSNHMLMVLVAAILMLVILPLAARRWSMVPCGLSNFFEAICVFIREEVARPVLGDNTDRFIKFLWTTFFFILFCNLLGMIPTDGIFYLISGYRLEHLGGAATANIWVTGALAVIAFIMIHISGIRQQGVWGYIRNFIPHVPWPLMPVMYVLEIIGSLVKPFALAIRLFANMLAGHTVLGAMLGLAFMARSYTIGGVTILGCAAISLLELFVAFLQAYIFTYLTTMFIGAAVHPEH
ncbi:MAG: F0F1 ATP synthase subunit A [Sedimentisphaerales bacterium]|nr:F0F1 ATP synthase subunit A [Sedimentisphaerales bacterium]